MIQLIDVTKTYQRGKHRVEALKSISLTIEAGEVFGLIGHSGAGKSTLLRCINLLEEPSAGKVIVEGHDLRALGKRGLQKQRQKIGMIFQHFHLLNSATVTDNIAFPLRLAGVSRSDIAKRVSELLSLVHLEGYERKFPGQLSGGQKQRVAIARALANEPSVLLCDEATSALDPQTTTSILDLLAEINRRLGLTIVIVTHEMAVVQRVCDRVAVLDEGAVAESGSVADVFLHPQHPVTGSLLSADEDVAGRAAALPTGDSADQQGTRRLAITFVGALTHSPVLAEVAKATDSTFSILKGKIDVLKDMPYGRLVVAWYGSDAQLDAAVDLLTTQGCGVQVLDGVVTAADASSEKVGAH